MATVKTRKTGEMFQFPTFGMARMTDQYREYVEKTLGQSKENYDRMRDGAETAAKTVEATLERTQSGTVEISLKAIDAVRQSTENSLTHLESLLGVKSVAEMIELQSTFFRKQSELMVDQARVMQETARKVAEEVSRPTREASEKAVNKAAGEVEKTVNAA